MPMTIRPIFAGDWDEYLAEMARGAAEPAPEPDPLPAAGWYADPSGQYKWRGWDGKTWTVHISS